MAEENKRSSEKSAAPGTRKPYAKPNVTSEPIYETLALACGKLAGQGGSCNAVPRRS
jgi:hypothetical protein